MLTVTSYLMWKGCSYEEVKERGKEALRSFGLERQENVKNRKPSGGQKRKLLVTTVINCETSVIFLGEPITGLDYISRRELWALLNFSVSLGFFLSTFTSDLIESWAFSGMLAPFLDAILPDYCPIYYIPYSFRYLSNLSPT